MGLALGLAPRLGALVLKEISSQGVGRLVFTGNSLSEFGILTTADRLWRWEDHLQRDYQWD
jgi:hypothetical protein